MLVKATTDRHPPSPTSQTATLLRKCGHTPPLHGDNSCVGVPDLYHSAPRGPRTRNQLRFSAHIGIFSPQNELLRQGTLDKPLEHVFHHDASDASVRLAKCSRPTLTQNNGDRLRDLFSITPTNAEMLTLGLQHSAQMFRCHA